MSRSSSSESEDDTGQGSTPPDLPPGQEMSAWSRRQVRKTTAVKSRTKPPSDSKSSHGETEEQGEDTSPAAEPKEEVVSSHPPEQAEAEPEPGPPARTTDTIRRFNISCRDGPSRVTIRVGFDVESPAQALLEACRLRSRMPALSTLREPDGVTLDLPDPVSEQISDGVNRLVAEAAPGRAAAGTSPPGDEEPFGASGTAAQPGPSQPVPMEGCEAAEEPASASTAGPVEAPAAKVAAKKEDEGARKLLLSDDCCTCYACNISVPYNEMMGQHMMSEGHIQSVAVFYGLKPP